MAIPFRRIQFLIFRFYLHGRIRKLGNENRLNNYCKLLRNIGINHSIQLHISNNYCSST